jgi:hypothetical protein
MFSNSDVWIQNIINISSERSLLLDSSQIRAKTLIKELTGSVPSFRWSYYIPSVIRNLTALFLNLQNLSLIDTSKVYLVSVQAKWLAQVWESISKLDERDYSQTLLINSAVTYEISGYQANALCIARKILDDKRLKSVKNCF